MASVRHSGGWLLSLAALWLGLSVAAPCAAAVAPTEQQLKAVFVFNFSHFVAWPPEAWTAPDDPFVIAVLGNDALATQLAAAVQDERLDTHPLVVRRLATGDDIPDCKILYIDSSEGPDLARLLAAVQHRATLTVSDLEGAAGRGVMIELASAAHRIHLLINQDAARAAQLTISSNLLRLASVGHQGG